MIEFIQKFYQYKISLVLLATFSLKTLLEKVPLHEPNMFGEQSSLRVNFLV